MTSQAQDDELIGQLLDPLTLVADADQAFFASLDDRTRALITLWTLTVQVLRNGVKYFVEDSPHWFVRSVVASCEHLSEPAVGKAFAALERELVASDKYRSGWIVPTAANRFAKRVDTLVTRKSAALQATVLRHVRDDQAALTRLAEEARTQLEARRQQREREEQRKLTAKARELEASRATAKKWTLHTTFAPGEVLDHATFGLGRVLGYADANKIRVEFADGTQRLLAHKPAR